MHIAVRWLQRREVLGGRLDHRRKPGERRICRAFRRSGTICLCDKHRLELLPVIDTATNT